MPICPYCDRPFERGVLVFRLTCPHCHRYVKITEIKDFLITDLSGYTGTAKRMNDSERKKVIKFIKRIFPEEVGE